MKYYVDTRIYEVVPETKINKYMAPETYFEYCDFGVENQVKEVWKCESGKRVDYVYPVENYGTGEEIDRRLAYFEAIGEKAMYLSKFVVPHSWYVKNTQGIR